MEVKGWDDQVRDDPPDLEPDNVIQARDNANEINADAVLLVTSRRSRQREVPTKAENHGVYYILQEEGIAFADLMAKQCAALTEVERDIRSVNDIPLDAATIYELFSDGSGGEIDTQDIQKLFK